MYKELREKIQQSEKFSLDYSGIFFYALNMAKNKTRIFMFNWLWYFICFCKGVKLGKKIIFNGNPIIRRYPNSTIRFGNNCTFNSAKESLSIGLSQPCSFVTWDENAQIIFGNNSGASGVKIQARSTIQIGDNVLIGAGSNIFDNDSHHSDPHKRIQDIIPSKPIKIEDNVFIGMQCVILKGVTIGRNAVIGARSVVFNDIPENCIAWGNPCKVILKKNLANHETNVDIYTTQPVNEPTY